MEYKSVYFLGIGGIGMSALARYFLDKGFDVGGYDLHKSELTEKLACQGADIIYEECVALLSHRFCDPLDTLVVYTPAIPIESSLFEWFNSNGFKLEKRSEVLERITVGRYVMAVAGTHGKTSTATLVAWLNHRALSDGIDAGGGSAFLGGISRNFESNLVLGDGERVVVEADEYDRSFLRLHPDVAIITSADADHLDIYGTHAEMKRAFTQFIAQIRDGGALIIKTGVDLHINNNQIAIYRYSLDEPSDFYANNIVLGSDGYYLFDLVTPDQTIEGCRLGVPGRINIENAVAAVAMTLVAGGVDKELLKRALSSFRGVKRRFEIYVNTPQRVYIDDYAHHPRELETAILSIKQMFPKRELTALFQPHLYSRTRDFASEFGAALSRADRVILLPIYPARELPIEGVDSQLIAQYITTPHMIVQKDAILDEIRGRETDVLVTFGAGDIDRYCGEIAKIIESKGEKLD